MDFQQAPTYTDHHNSTMMCSRYSNDEDYTMPTKNHDHGLLHEDKFIIVDFPLKHRQHETQVLKLADRLTQSATKKAVVSCVLKNLPESLRQLQLQKGEKALDEEDFLDSDDDDDDDLEDSIHITKRRFNAKLVRLEEETRKGLEQAVGYIGTASAPMVQQYRMRAMAA